MKAKEIVKDILSDQNISNVDFAHELGISPNALWDRLNNAKAKDLSMATLSEMLDKLGYKVVVIPENYKVKSGYEIV